MNDAGFNFTSALGSGFEQQRMDMICFLSLTMVVVTHFRVFIMRTGLCQSDVTP
jgi:hypothetical protein